MKTLDELLIGTKYEGATSSPDWKEKVYYAGMECVGEKEGLEQCAINMVQNAALASLLPAAVKALEELVGFHGRIDQENIDKCRATLSAISEATKAVEGKR